MDFPLFEIVLVAAAGLVGVCVCLGAVLFYYREQRSILRLWADRNGYEILSSEGRHLFSGPFFLKTFSGQHVYRVTVRDSRGTIRKGWVRCGGAWLGCLSSHADAEWDNP